MNRLEYNERIYNYKHGLVNSAGSQTIKHNSVKEEEKTTEPEVKKEPQEQEEEIEHSALGDEWDKHKYIRKEEYADGTVKYIYEDGSSRTEHNKPMATEGTGKSGGGTPGGSYGNTPKAPQTGTPGGVSGKSISATALNEQRAAQTTPTGLYGNTPKSTPAEKVQDVKLGSKSTPTGLYSNQYKPNNEAYAEARLNGNTTPGGIPYGQTVKDAKISYVAKKDVTPGTLYGATGDRPIANHRIGQGTPGGVNGPKLKDNSYGAKKQQTAEIWNNLKNAVKDAPQQQTEQPKQEPVITNGTPGGVNGPSISEGKEAQSFWNLVESNIKANEQPTVEPKVIEETPSAAEEVEARTDEVKALTNERVDELMAGVPEEINRINSSMPNASYDDKLTAFYYSPYVQNTLDVIYEGVMSGNLSLAPVIVQGEDGVNRIESYNVVHGNNQAWNDILEQSVAISNLYLDNLSDEYISDVEDRLFNELKALNRASGALHKYN